MAQQTIEKITLTGNITTNWPTAFGTGVTIEDINQVNASSGPYNIAMPDATLVSPGRTADFNNISLNSFNIMANDGSTLITSVAAGIYVRLYLDDTSTANGVWRVALPGSGPLSINNLKATSVNNSVIISNGSITPPGGTIDFSISDSLINFNGISNKGFVAVTSVAPLTFGSRTFGGDSNISVSNGNGVLANPVISLNADLINLTSVKVGGTYLTGTTIAPISSNTGITINSNGSGDINLNGVLIDTIGSISEVGNLTVNGIFNNALMPKVSVVFNDTLVGDTNLITIIDSSNNLVTVTRTNAGTYDFGFGLTLDNNNYGVQMTAGTNGGVTPTMVLYSYVTSTMTKTSVTIQFTDLSGIPVTSLPYGATVQIIQS